MSADQPEGELLPLPSQLSMFANESARPEGLHYRPDFISAQEEATLIGHIRGLPLAPFQFGIYEGKRRVVFFGSRYDFTHQRLEAAEELAAWLAPLGGQVERFAALPSGSIKHALCTEYDVGAGIGWHRDKKHFDQVFGLSLASACKFRFRQQVGTLHAQRAATLALRDDRRLPPCHHVERAWLRVDREARSEEHTSELHSLTNLA